MTIPLWSDYVSYLEHNSGGKPYLTPYLIEGSSSAMIICPGGGYQHLANHEGEPVAKWLNDHNISAFVLTYRIAPHHEPAPQMDARRAVRYVRRHADEYGIDRNKIGILGFSAGGHVAAMTGIVFESGDPESDDPVERESSRPDLMVLCYPVITMKDFGHRGSCEQLLGISPSEDKIIQYSAEMQVTADTPPTFIWHTADDGAVPVENSLQLALSLSHSNIPYALHIFPKGKHGLGLATDILDVSVWPSLCMTWLKNQGM
ncbi:acetyl esterase/lipase [Paenibacillus sp. DS2015]|uniref:alpha/beta hydrolase n=1 Tax=Paenibacillus sp. DS2015 TaxID=3373917 RepID=UPI003D1E2E6E